MGYWGVSQTIATFLRIIVGNARPYPLAKTPQHAWRPPYAMQFQQRQVPDDSAFLHRRCDKTPQTISIRTSSRIVIVGFLFDVLGCRVFSLRGKMWIDSSLAHARFNVSGFLRASKARNLLKGERVLEPQHPWASLFARSFLLEETKANAFITTKTQQEFSNCLLSVRMWENARVWSLFAAWCSITPTPLLILNSDMAQVLKLLEVLLVILMLLLAAAYLRT